MEEAADALAPNVSCWRMCCFPVSVKEQRENAIKSLRSATKKYLSLIQNDKLLLNSHVKDDIMSKHRKQSERRRSSGTPHMSNDRNDAVAVPITHAPPGSTHEDTPGNPDMSAQERQLKDFIDYVVQKKPMQALIAMQQKLDHMDKRLENMYTHIRPLEATLTGGGYWTRTPSINKGKMS
eukprot:358479-Chlamydomonas_euryale.AAC.3